MRADWDTRFALGRRLDRPPAWHPRERPPSAVLGTWSALVPAAAAASRSPTIARDLGWSRRHLTEQFTRAVGVSPKTYARIVRFDRARSLIAAGGSLGDVALDAGYYDQAHLNRDFREFAGAAPTQLPFVQDRLEPAA